MVAAGMSITSKNERSAGIAFPQGGNIHPPVIHVLDVLHLVVVIDKEMLPEEVIVIA